MSTHEIAAPQSPPLVSHLRDREEQADFLSNASKLLITTSKLVASDLDVEMTLAAIAALVFPHPGVRTVLEVGDGVATRRIGLADGPSFPAGSVLTVALSSRAETLGALTFVAPPYGHVFDDRDRQLAKDVAAGASLAIAHSRLAAARQQSQDAIRLAAAERLAFISSLSHGLRTPLHAIHGYAQLLDAEVRGPLNAGQRHDVHRIQANERHLLSLVDSVIGFARWDDGEPLALEDIFVHRAVGQTNAIVLRAASENAIIYDPEGDAIDTTLTVRAEPRRLREILLQLLLNAVRSSQPGDSVFVRAAAIGEKAWIRVTDTGIGTDKRQVDDGVGLGLAITQQLARAMGGELSVSSEAGHGSTFTLILPRGRFS